jgi:lipopolysaccharide export system permease protein
VGRVALLRLVPVLGASIPLALLFAILISIGRMRAHGELGALQSCGVSPLALLRPVLWTALALTAVGLLLSLWLAPRASRQLNADMLAAATTRPAAVLRSGVVSYFGDLRVQAREVSSDGANLRGVVAWIPSLGGSVFAKRAKVISGDEGPATVQLEDGVILAGEDGRPSEVRFGKFERELVTAAAAEPAQPLAAVSTRALLDWERTGADASDSREVGAELHRRASLPVATALFAVLAVPLALVGGAARSRSGGMLLGLVVTIAYYALVQLADGLGRDERVPLAVLWLPNAVLLGLALTLIAWFAKSHGKEWSGLRSGRDVERRRRRLRVRRRVLDRYVLRSFAGLVVLSLGGLVIATLLVDVLDNLKWFTKYQSTPDEVLRYYTARTPILLSRVLPMALVVSAALTMGLLTSTGELIGMRSCGISSARVATPILLSCVLMAGFYHLLANEWVPHASAAATRIKQTEIKNRSAARSVWYRAGDILYEIERLDPLNGVARGVTTYELDPEGLPRSVTRAGSARHLGDGDWQLEQPQRWVVTEDGLRAEAARAHARLGNDVPADVETGDLPLGALRREIREAEEDGFDPLRFKVDLHLRLAAPIACILLPALALAFAVSGPPYPSGGQVLVVSFLLVVGQALLSAAGAALGYGDVLPPPAAGWGPLGILLLAGAWLGRRLSWPVWSR